MQNNDMELINKLSRKELKKEDVYTFTLTLCDNDTDRDFERFSVEALTQLQKLFIGKTGISDHSMRSKDQAFRIYDTFIEKDENKKTACGDFYVALKAKAYTVKTDSNSSLIAEIDGGIKKEVSISCCAEKSICSICGSNMKNHECKHIKGKVYGGKQCTGILEDITDAYEWSFVAVPAQRKAGVTKSFKSKEAKPLEKAIEIIKSVTEDTVISANEANEIIKYVNELESLAAEVSLYKQHLTDDIRRYALTVMPKVNIKQFTKGCQFMGLTELKELRDSLKKQAGELIPPAPQLKTLKTTNSQNNTAFKI